MFRSCKPSEKEGEARRKKILQYTRHASVGFVAVQTTPPMISKMLRCWFDCLKQKCSNLNDMTRDSARKYAKCTKNDEQRAKILENEVTSLQQKCKKLSLQKDAEVASLILEKDFVWN